MAYPTQHTARRTPTSTIVIVLAVLALLLAPMPSATAAPVVSASAGPVPAAVKTAKLAKPALTVVPGNKRITVSWKRVAGAKSYVIEYATAKSFAKAKKVKTATTTRAITGLKLGTDYWVRVKAVNGGTTSASKAVKVRPNSRAVGRPTAKVTSAGQNKVKVSWSKLPQATKVTLVASWDEKTLGKSSTRFSVTGIAPTATSATLTVPKKFRKYVGSTTGNPVYVQVWAYNGVKKSTSRAAYGYASPPAVTGTAADRVTFAAYNVGSIAATQNTAGRGWAKRRTAVARAIKHAGASVVMVQEATTMKHSNAKRQYQDLGDLLGSEYKLAYDASVVGTAGGNLTKGDHIYYKPADVVVLASGVESAKKITPKSVRWVKADGKSVEKDRYFSWARMRNKSNGAEFYVVSIHLQTGRSIHTERIRKGVIRAIDAYIAAKPDGKRLPVVMGGDYNSQIARDPNGAQTVLVQRGYVDAAATARRSGQQYSTSNNNSDKGYPAKPFRYAYSASRIDYIFVKNGAGSVRYRNQVILKAGKFNEDYRGSDHNLQYAQLVIPRR